MAIKAKTIKWIVILLALTVTGLTALQASLLSGAMELKESSFQRNVMSALGRASDELALGEATSAFLSSTVDRRRLGKGAMVVSITSDEALDVDAKVIRGEIVADFSPFDFKGDTISYSVDSPQRIKIGRRQADGELDTVLVDSFHQPGEYKIIVDQAGVGEHLYSWHSEKDSAHVLTNQFLKRRGRAEMELFGELRSDSGKFQLVTRAMQNFIEAESIPIGERLDSINVDSVVRVALEHAGIELDFVYAVFVESSDSAQVISDSVFASELSASEFRVRLFPQDIFAEPTHLSLFFPGHQMFLWEQMTPMLGATAFLIMLIVGSFGYSIRALNNQRRVSDLMVEFINNMTHEFKTPISTIALASEAIDRAEIVTSPEKIKRFNEMIKSEATRMRGQTERILQMAALEERTLELAPIEVDLHEVLADAIRAVDLHVSANGGKIEREFKATNSLLEADKVHLLNIAHNLLDNANKYSSGAPIITVRTFDSDRGIGFRIEDEGIGIDIQSQKQVFDKYFRAPTGNVHNVKGFGLGLSYVKLIVEQHGGDITLHSVPGEKTEVEVILPRKQGSV